MPTWIQASERLPKRFYDETYYVKLDNMLPRLGLFSRRNLEGVYDDLTKEPYLIVLTNGAAPEFEVSVDKFTGVQWLDEAPESPAPGVEEGMYLLTKEQLKEVWEASFDWHYNNAYGEVPNKKPDFDTYVSTLAGAASASKREGGELNAIQRAKLEGEILDILYEANGTGSGSEDIYQHLKQHYTIIKK